MKKFLILCLIILLSFCGCVKKTDSIYLEDKYYETGVVKEITGEELKNLEDSEESFIVFVHLPYCSMLACFEPVLDEFINDNNITVYSALSTKIDNTKLSGEVKHFPTVAIYNKGEIIAYLDAKSDDDLKYYQSLEDFTNWFSKYVYLQR